MELFHQGEWGTICDDDFSIHNANVLCRHLGFVSATGWTHSAKYGKGQGKRDLGPPSYAACCRICAFTMMVHVTQLGLRGEKLKV